MAFKDVEKRNEYSAEYIRTNYTKVSVNFDNEKDRDIIEKLHFIKDSKGVKVIDYLRKVIRADLEKEKERG